MSKSYGQCMFRLLRNCQTALQSNCTTLYSQLIFFFLFYGLCLPWCCIQVNPIEPLPTTENIASSTAH